MATMESIMQNFSKSISALQDKVSGEVESAANGELDVASMGKINYITTQFSVVAEMASGVLKSMSDVCNFAVQKL